MSAYDFERAEFLRARADAQWEFTPCYKHSWRSTRNGAVCLDCSATMSFEEFLEDDHDDEEEYGLVE